MGWRESIAKLSVCVKCHAQPPSSNGYCKGCNRVYARASYAANPTPKREAAKVCAQRTRLKALLRIADGPLACKCCGEVNPAFLSIDHINGGGQAQRNKDGVRGGTKFFYWILSKADPKDFQILCYNCNLGKRCSDRCPHQEVACLSL